MGSSRNSSQYNSFQTKVDSNPIAHRVRRKRQRLPPNLLIENASDRGPPPAQKSAPRRFRSRLAATRKLPAREPGQQSQPPARTYLSSQLKRIGPSRKPVCGIAPVSGTTLESSCKNSVSTSAF